jgi:hypothetical protein
MPKQASQQFVLTGRVTLGEGHDHGPGAIPGKARLHLQTEGGCYLAHVASPPPLGSWVALTGEWVRVELGPAPLGTSVEYQVDATGWVSLPDGYDPNLDGDLREWLSRSTSGRSLQPTKRVDSNIPNRNTD